MNVWSNFKFTARLFTNNLSTSLMAVLVLAAGIGISVTMFAFVNGHLWSSPKIADDVGFVSLSWMREGERNRGSTQININDYFDMRAENKSFSQFVAYQWQRYQVFHPKLPYASTYNGVNVSDNFFNMVGEQPLLGQLPAEQEAKDGKEKIVAIGFDVWQNDFGGDTDILGKSIQLNGKDHRVIAIMPKGFAFPSNQQLWVINDFQWSKSRPRKKQPRVNVLGVLKNGVSEEQALLDLKNIAAALKEKHPESNKNYNRVEMKSFNEQMSGQWLIDTLTMILGFSFLVLAIACINVSNLVMARVAKRQHELAVRKSLGASKSSIFFQVILDALFVSVLGAVFGLIIAHWGTDYIWDVVFTNYGQFIPYWWHVNINSDVILFTLGVTLLSALLSSVIPAFKVLSSNSIDILKDSTRTSSGLAIGRLAKAMVAIQILAATVLLCTALTRIIFIAEQSARELTFEPDNILSARIQAGGNFGFKSVQSVYKFYEELVTRTQAIPGVENVALSFNLPAVFGAVEVFEIDGQAVAQTEEDKIRTSVPIVGGDFFDLVNVKTLQGRVFNSADVEGGQPVAVVNQYFVDKFFPNENPIGKRVRVFEPGNFSEGQNSKRESSYSDWLTIVGVVANFQGENLAVGRTENVLTELYMPFSQWLSRGQFLLVEGQGDVNRYAEDIKRILADIAPLMSMQDRFRTITQVMDRNYVFRKLLRDFMVTFGITALIMAAIGLFGLVSFSTQLKYREFGIRMALGASAKKVLLLVLNQNKWQILFGILIGGCAAYAADKLIVSITASPEMGEKIMAYTAISLPIGVLSVLLVTMFATVIPAWKATKVSAKCRVKDRIM